MTLVKTEPYECRFIDGGNFRRMQEELLAMNGRTAPIFVIKEEHHKGETHLFIVDDDRDLHLVSLQPNVFYQVALGREERPTRRNVELGIFGKLTEGAPIYRIHLFRSSTWFNQEQQDLIVNVPLIMVANWKIILATSSLYLMAYYPESSQWSFFGCHR